MTGLTRRQTAMLSLARLQGEAACLCGGDTNVAMSLQRRRLGWYDRVRMSFTVTPPKPSVKSMAGHTGGWNAISKARKAKHEQK